MKKQVLISILTPIVIAVVFGLLNLLPDFHILDRRIYDLLLHYKPPLTEDKAILLIDIDDTAIARVGTWPWGRDKIADGLQVMKEFDARYAVFDIEYVDKAPTSFNPEVLNEQIPAALKDELSQINDNAKALFDALRTGQIKPREAEPFIKDFGALTDAARATLLARIKAVTRDNDEYFGKAAKFFGSAWFTVNMLPEADPLTPADIKAWARDNVPLKNAGVSADYPHKAADLRPAIKPILGRAAGAGFPNVYIDEDGVRRRIALVYGYGERWFGQLAFRPLLSWLGNPGLEAGREAVTLRGAKLPDGSVKDIRIPLDEDSRFIINWPAKTFIESYRHISFYDLLAHKELEKNLLHNLRLMNDAGYLNYHPAGPKLLDPYYAALKQMEEAFDKEDPSALKNWRELKEGFIAEVGKFLRGGADQLMVKDIEAALAGPNVPPQQRQQMEALKKEVPEVFAKSRDVMAGLEKNRAALKANLPGSFCIIGNTGTSTTDIGVNPFEKQYMNVGTHASVVNTILSGRFLDELPWWYGALAGLAAALLTGLVISRLNPLPSIIVGFAILLAAAAAGSAFFLLSGAYVGLLTPVLSVFLTFLVLSLLKFLRTAQEKTYIRNAFSHYLSADVISDIINDPSKLKLGGEKKFMTAIFTDVRGFSTVSEKLDASDLVKLLNFYLTAMSDTILELKGTIDKYEGDAIISFFGAPIPLEDHAARACRASVFMKRKEIELNRRFLDEKLSPTPLYTRIGVNTGDMVVGNMGTPKKMDYTIMGNSVNLAARLEGVNKQYGTWILASEATYEASGGEFLARRLDRVRVVGIATPVRLYEIIDVRAEASPATRETVEQFHAGIDWFEKREWTRAARTFQELLRHAPGDGPSETFLKRCNDYEQKPPPDSWDGVFNLGTK